VIFVEASDEQRLNRVAASRGWTFGQLRSREESQLSLERKRKEADDVVDNSRGAEHARLQLEAVLSRMEPPQPS
jgi:dephospho-CoA kinase